MDKIERNGGANRRHAISGGASGKLRRQLLIGTTGKGIKTQEKKNQMSSALLLLAADSNK
jgi:hypothetical protein